MRVLVQRVTQAKVEISGELHAYIADGMLIFLGIEDEDGQADVEWLVRKLLGLRIFADEQGKMNLSVVDAGAEALVVSQFTLHASTKKGNRPSFIRAARPEKAIPLYEAFIVKLKMSLNSVQSGQFGADMKVMLINDGPVTIMIDSKQKE